MRLGCGLDHGGGSASAASCDCEVTPAGVLVQNQGFFQYWMGEVMEICKPPGGGQSNTLIKVRITGVTDKSSYSCGQTLTFRMTDVSDAKARAFALRSCR